jgi:DNA-binding GntR family transcriptional regulator
MVEPRLGSAYLSKSDVAYVELRQLILGGGLPAGSRLAQYELAERLRMSITPLREAIRRLSAEGLVELDHHRDARVAPMSVAEARQLFEVRLVLEPAATSLAAQRRSPEELRVMRDALARLLPVTRRWGEEALLAHGDFHRAVYRSSHNDVMIKTLDDLWAKSDRYRRLGLELPAGDQPRERDLDEHRQIFECVERGDAEQAQDLATRHIAQSLTAAAIEALQDIPSQIGDATD